MFKFLSGVATGWIAARALEAKDKDISPFSPPTISELTILSEQLKKLGEHIQDILKEDTKK